MQNAYLVRMGFVILPELVKKCEMGLPLSARRAMVSAEVGFLWSVFSS
jgi:hypothetical protein